MAGSGSVAEQKAQIQAEIDKLPAGPVRAALERALAGLQDVRTPLFDALSRRCDALESRSALLSAGAEVLTPSVALALLLHTYMLELGFVCEGSGGAPAATSSPVLAGFAPPQRDVSASVLVPEGWVSPDGSSTTATYRFTGDPTPSSVGESLAAAGLQKGAKLSLATLRIGDALMVHAQGQKPGASASAPVQTAATELSLAGFSAGSGSAGGEEGRAPWTREQVKEGLMRTLAPLASDGGSGSGAGSSGLQRLQAQVWESVLLPAFGLSAAARAASGATSSSAAAAPSSGPFGSASGGSKAGGVAAPAPSTGGSSSSSNPLMIGGPRRPPEPRFDDDDDDGGGYGRFPGGGFPRSGGSFPGGGGFGGRGGLPSIGGDDLMPSFGGAVPGGMFGGGGGGGFGGPFGPCGGSLVGPEHPLFGGGGGVGGYPGVPGYGGPGRGGLPPGVPPGARFDPFGPPGVGTGIPDGGGRGRGGFPPGVPQPPRGTGSVPGLPQPDHLVPPRNEDGSDGGEPDAGAPPPDMYS
jgi:hypothetical protein